MYTQVFAKSAVNEDSRGKTSRVWSDVDKINFSINKEHSLLVVTASCYDEKKGYGAYDVEREFHLEFERNEVEKLVSTALNEKLLKQLDIENLAVIDKVSALELSLEKLQKEFDESRIENAILRARVEAAISTLSGDAPS